MQRPETSFAAKEVLFFQTVKSVSTSISIFYSPFILFDCKNNMKTNKLMKTRRQSRKRKLVRQTIEKIQESLFIRGRYVFKIISHNLSVLIISNNKTADNERVLYRHYSMLLGTILVKTPRITEGKDN